MKERTAIDGRIVQTLRDLSLKRSAANAKTMNFERIALKFGLAHDAFETIHCIYHQFASVSSSERDPLYACFRFADLYLDSHCC